MVARHPSLEKMLRLKEILQGYISVRQLHTDPSTALTPISCFFNLVPCLLALWGLFLFFSCLVLLPAPVLSKFHSLCWPDRRGFCLALQSIASHGLLMSSSQLQYLSFLPLWVQKQLTMLWLAASPRDIPLQSMHLMPYKQAEKKQFQLFANYRLWIWLVVKARYHCFPLKSKIWLLWLSAYVFTEISVSKTS